MFTRIEAITGAVAVVTLVTAVMLAQDAAPVANVTSDTQVAGVGAGAQVVQEDTTNRQIETRAMNENQGLIINDVVEGVGAIVETGDTVSVHYVGTLQNGQEFDSSKKRGTPLEFTVGAGQVITGWEQGLLGMRVGGERSLVIPPELAYGDRGIGPIPGGATLLFTIELLEIK
jgi:peptidylprolyl isomerase